MKRNTHTPCEKAKLVLEVIRGEQTISEIAFEHGIIRIKECIDRIHTAHPEYCFRRISAALLRSDSLRVNRKALKRHMREMGLRAIYSRQKTSTPEPMNKVYPYLLKDVNIEHPNHVWRIDITYVPIRNSWLCLTAIMDWYSRYVVSRRIRDSLEIGL